MNTEFNKVVIIGGGILLMFSSIVFAQPAYWPIPNTDTATERMSGTFGEIHGSNRFHGAIDIDHDNSNQTALATEDGVVVVNDGYQGGRNPDDDYVVLEHGTAPDNNRRSVYMHINQNHGLTNGDPVQRGNTVAIINNNSQSNGHHLHFELWWRLFDDEWHTLNPLNNDRGWALPRPQDDFAPELNQAFFKGVEYPAHPVESGYRIVAPVNPQAHDALVPFHNNTAARIHFRDRPGRFSNHLTPYDVNRDKLVIFGNIGTIAHCRETSANARGINTNSLGEGASVFKMAYFIDQRLNYNITFDEFLLRTNAAGAVFPESVGDDEDIFHRRYNDITGQNGRNDYKYGNNDYIRLFNAGVQQNDCLGNCHGAYLPPHKAIDVFDGYGFIPVQSNGIWFTKARKTDSPSWVFNDANPPEVARSQDEALYPDGEHTLLFRTEDTAGLFDEAEVKVIVDNFLPYIEKVTVTSGGVTLYEAGWEWDATDERLKLSPNNPEEGIIRKASGKQDIFIIVTASEPMNWVNITDIQPMNWHPQANGSPNTDRTEWTFLIPAGTEDPDGNGNSYTRQELSITGEDLAGNAIEGYSVQQQPDGTLSTDPQQVPQRTANGWDPAPAAGADTIHRFEIGDWADGFLASYGGEVNEQVEAMIPSLRYNDQGTLEEDGFVVAGFTESFGSGAEDFWVAKLDEGGKVSWQKAYGGSGHDYGFAIRQTLTTSPQGDPVYDGYIVAGKTSSFGAASYDIWLVKLDERGNLQWHKTLGGPEGEHLSSAEALRQTDDDGDGIADDGYIIAGQTSSFSGGGGDDILLLKVSQAGELEWVQKYGGISADLVYSICQTANGHYALAGRTRSKNDPDDLSYDLLVLEVDATGSLVWYNRYAGTGGSAQDLGYSIWQASDGRYLVAGATNSTNLTLSGVAKYDALVMTVDPQPQDGTRGLVDWAGVYGALANHDRATMIRQLPTGSYLVGSYTNSFQFGSYDLDLFTIDSGVSTHPILWQKVYGGPGDDRLSAVHQRPGSDGYLIAGHSTSLGSGGRDAIAMKTDNAGNLNEAGDLTFRDSGGNLLFAEGQGRYLSSGNNLSGAILVGVGDSQPGMGFIHQIDLAAGDVTQQVYSCSGPTPDAECAIVTDTPVVPNYGYYASRKLLVRRIGHWNGDRHLPVWNGDRYCFGLPPENRVEFLIENTGSLSAMVSLSLEGADAGSFSISKSPPAQIEAGISGLFSIDFTPGSDPTEKTVQVTIANDSDDNPYRFSLTAQKDQVLCNGGFEDDLTFWQGNATLVQPGYPDSGQAAQIVSSLEQLISGPFRVNVPYRLRAQCKAGAQENCFGGVQRSRSVPMSTSVSDDFSAPGSGDWRELSVWFPVYAADEWMSVYMQGSAGQQPVFDGVRVEGAEGYQLLIEKAGDGSGRVLGNGIDCGSDCEEVYSNWNGVTLEAIPDNDSYFVRWELGDGHILSATEDIL
ncbi:MAG: peptidoglycan DD-metalloendopeptidase family protein [bacterium]|nr:peptidoglycan DD-metalloendopeptidase family protein [bacterium]